MTVQEMQDLVFRVLRERHLPAFMARAAVKKVPQLQRWA
jgi:hypothetical protein